ncbi:MAG: RDD family protein [Planctomycetota bacterium]
MTDLLVETTEGIRLRHEVAGAGSRAAAGGIDLGLFAIAYLVLLVAALVAGAIEPAGIGGFAIGVLAGGAGLLLVAYHAVLPLFLGGRTAGKRLLGIRVHDLQGTPASAFQHLVRALFLPLELFLAIPVPLGLVLIAATARHQRLGDLVAGTIALRDPRRGAVPEPFPRECWSGLASRRLSLVPALAERFDGADVDFLRRLLARRGLHARAREDLLLRSARHYAAVLGVDLGPRPTATTALALLHELYLYLRETRGAYSSSR